MRDGQNPVMEFTRFFFFFCSLEYALTASGANSLCAVLARRDVSDVCLWGRYRTYIEAGS